MKYITAPWREEYVKEASKMTECIFCQAVNMKDNRETHILYRGEHNFIILNRYPYTPGHLMIAPYIHMDSIEKADKGATDEMTDLLKFSIKILRQHYRPHGFNTGMNIGRSAGAGVADHYHLHVIPRWTGDSNFMPLIGKTKVVIEGVDSSYEKLVPLFRKGD
ncbi:MAG: HIT domain-containing protein [Candidatus Aminicenantes bacterium]|jgi:ATP adenylyltransferase|nr:HIT domain-containing protein [Candidatus Aminicenantes bacterium]